MTTKKFATSVKLENELAEQVKQICKEQNCSQTDFIKNAVKKAVNESDFEENDNGINDKVYSELDPEPKPKVEDVEEPKPKTEIKIEPEPRLELQFEPEVRVIENPIRKPIPYSYWEWRYYHENQKWTMHKQNDPLFI